MGVDFVFFCWTTVKKLLKMHGHRRAYG